MKKILIVLGGIVIFSSSVAYAEECIKGDDLMYAVRTSKRIIQNNMGGLPHNASPLNVTLKEGDVILAQEDKPEGRHCTYSIGNIEAFSYFIPK